MGAASRVEVGVDGSAAAQSEGDRRRVIHDAAIQVFSAQGFASTSMADIAAAADMSRPALYQYFLNKGDIFRSAFVALFEQTVERSVQALAEDVTTEEQLAGCLQRFEGDLYERMAASPHAADIMQAKNEHVAEALPPVIEGLRIGLNDWLERTMPGTGKAIVERRASLLDLIRLSPYGFKVDAPTVEVYRARLSALARSVAADLAGD